MPLSMTSIPLAQNYRQTLRLYALVPDDEGVPLRVELYAVGATGDVLLEQRVVTLFAPPPPPPNQIGTPLGQMTITDLFARDFGGAERARITITPLGTAVPYWAFVSVTNNTTQHVTTITPH